MNYFFGLDMMRGPSHTLAQQGRWERSNLKELSDYILEAETEFTCFRYEAFTTLSATQGVVGAVRS
jgi:hypothetical protein